MHRVIVLIPARYGSTRFPGKPIAKINGKEMILHVIENCLKAGFDYAVVTDDAKIESVVRDNNYEVVRVDDDVETGSERIALAYKRFFAEKNYDYIVNVQGDEPLLRAQDIQKVVESHMKSGLDIGTAIRINENFEDYNNPNIVKCVYAKSGKAMYFSRSSISHQQEFKQFNQHIGIYSYKAQALLKFANSKQTFLEKIEDVELLRALEIGLKIKTLNLEGDSFSVDTLEDYHRAKDKLRKDRIFKKYK